MVPAERGCRQGGEGCEVLSEAVRRSVGCAVCGDRGCLDGYAASPSLYRSSAQSLIPSVEAAGFNETSGPSGSARRASASYTRSTPVPLTATIAVRVFQTEAAAKASYVASCPGCNPGTVAPQKWTYKLRYDNPGQPNRGVTLSALCRNVTTQMALAGAIGPTSLHRTAKLAVWKVFDKAVSLGMTQCGSTPTPPPRTGSYYWTEAEAEAIAVKKIRIPYCNVYPDDPGCSTQGAVGLHSAECRGLDEKPGTFTYSRFTCDVLVGYYGRIRGRLAVWPTGPTTLRWEII